MGIYENGVAGARPSFGAGALQGVASGSADLLAALAAWLRLHAKDIALFVAFTAIAVASRVVLGAFPHVKPVAGITMIAGFAGGPAFGMMVGANAMFVSNFAFGQGPWTVWQMAAFGACGFAAGMFAKCGIVPRGGWGRARRVAISLAAGAFVLCVAGPILDTSALFMGFAPVTPGRIAAVYAAGVPVNALHAAATAATVFAFGSSVTRKAHAALARPR